MINPSRWGWGWGKEKREEKGETATASFLSPPSPSNLKTPPPEPYGRPDTQVIGESLYTFFASLTYGILLSDKANKIKSRIIVRA